jgi:transcriptional regulator with XRE-family HTH domain
MPSSQTISQDDSDVLYSLLGGQVLRPPEFDSVDVLIGTSVRRVRGQILAEAAAQGVGVRELARRTNVSPSAASRYLRSEGDMRVSTAVIFAHALSCTWQFVLKRNDETFESYFNYDLFLRRSIIKPQSVQSSSRNMQMSETELGAVSSGSTTIGTTVPTGMILFITTPLSTPQP